VEFAPRGITAQLVERRPFVASPGAADAMILVDPDDLAAHPTRDLAQLAFLIGRGLIDRTDAEIDNRSAHSSTLPVWRRKNAMRRTDNQPIFDTRNWTSKIARFLRFSARAFRGVFSYTWWHPAPAAKRHIPSHLLQRPSSFYTTLYAGCEGQRKALAAGAGRGCKSTVDGSSSQRVHCVGCLPRPIPKSFDGLCAVADLGAPERGISTVLGR